jgi:hypothetical protein
MDKVQFDTIMGSIGEVKSDVKDIRTNQVIQGKKLAVVCDRVKSHSTIHKATGMTGLALFLAWLKSKFGT